MVDIVKDATVTKGLPAASLRARVESSLASAIISGELEPGTMVSVPVLAAQFEVSITPVREAMLNLEDRGFVESVKNKGFKVTEVSARDLHEIAQFFHWRFLANDLGRYFRPLTQVMAKKHRIGHFHQRIIHLEIEQMPHPYAMQLVEQPARRQRRQTPITRQSEL